MVLFPSNIDSPLSHLQQLAKLTLARDIHPDKLSFELLMQRDLDEQRVFRKMEPYLNPNPNQVSPDELSERIVYFPPLLAVIVPVSGRVMETQYAKEHAQIVNHEAQEQIKHIIREGYGWFKLTDLPRCYEVDFKAGKVATSGLSNVFDQLVLKQVAASIEVTTQAFKNQLYDTHLKSEILESKASTENAH